MFLVHVSSKIFQIFEMAKVDQLLPIYETEEEALNRILAGRDVMETIFREPVYTFIPPHNMYSDGTMAALAEAEIPLVSSEGEAYFDYDATTFDFADDELVRSRSVIRACEEKFEDGEVCVIMLHPQDFADGQELNPTKYEEYLDLLEWIEEENISSVRFKDFVESEREEEVSDRFDLEYVGGGMLSTSFIFGEPEFLGKLNLPKESWASN